MAGEIKSLTGTPPQTAAPGTHSPKRGSAPVSASSLNRNDVDSIRFTDITVGLKKLESFLSQLPIEDEKRVGAIREEIAAGLYKIDDTRVADKLLKFEHLYHGANTHVRSSASA